MINKNFTLTPSDIEKFREDGYLILRNFLSDEILHYLEKLANDNIQEPKTNYGSGFRKLKYDLGNNDERIFDLINDKKFNNTLYELTNQKLLFTQGLSFALEKNKSTGFPWHVGTQSFGFQRKDDYACTLWIPFCQIDPNTQRGGMAYVSKKYLSGDFVYQYINLIPEHLRARKRKMKVDFDYFNRTKNNILNLPEISDVLTHHAEEGFFSLKDALLFDKYVIHRSVKLEDGEINTRVAFALRFIDINSKYDAFRAEQLEYPKHEFNYAGSSDFNILICEEDGQNVADSHYYKDNLERRTISGSR